MTSVAIIGAGIAGITLARQLQDSADVQIFEKSRGLGGRMAVRHAEPYDFDHGAQFFTARSRQFQTLLEGFIAEGKVDAWEPRVITLGPNTKPYKREWFEPHYVAVPGMNALCKALAQKLPVNLETRVSRISAGEQGWLLEGSEGQGLGQFDWVISTLPAPQADELLPACFAPRAQLGEAGFSPCFSLMLGFDSAPRLHFDAAVVRDSAIGWIAQNSSKAGRPPAHALLVHSDNAWAREHLEDEIEAVREKLLDALQPLLGDSLPTAAHSAIHRWKYARAETSCEDNYLLDDSNRLAACGDWCGGNRVEDAFLSGLELGKHLQTLLRRSC